MNKIIKALSLILLFTSCFKEYDDYFLITKKAVEFEDAVVVSNATGRYYPILPNVFTLHGTVSYQVNMFGEQSNVDQNIKYRIVDEESTAVEGKDFEFVNGDGIVIPANSSFGNLELNVLPTIEGTKILVVELVGNDEVQVSEKYKTIGIMMSNAVTIPDPNIVEDYGDYLHIKDIVVGGDGNLDLGCFIDLETANIYTWEGAALYPEKAILGYFQSNANYANLVFPGLSSMTTAWPSYYNRILDWDVAPTGSVIRFTNITPVDEQFYNDISSSDDIKSAFEFAKQEIGNRHGNAPTFGPGERIRNINPGDIVFVYSSTSDFYAIIKITEALLDNETPSSERTIRFEYKVQNRN